jgi:hypothetical protein
MARNAWSFVDPVTMDTYTLPVNPNADNGSHSFTRSINYEALAGVRRNSSGEDTVDALVFDSNVEQKPFSYSGFVYNKEQYDNFNEWTSKGYPFEIYDDLGRGFLVYIISFQYSRVRSRQFPYKHSYEMQGIILEELGV